MGVRSAVVGLTLVGIVAGACSGNDAGVAPAPTETTATGPPIVVTTMPNHMAPIAEPGEWFVDFASRGLGTLQVVDRECWTLDQVLLVLPQGSQLSSDGRAVVTPSGDVIASGSAVEVMARLVPVEGWPGGDSGRWQQHVDRCDPGATWLVVADVMEVDAYDPSLLDDAEMVAMLDAADFTEYWGCGFRYATSTADQRVAVVVEVPWDDRQRASVVLPDERFDVTVRVGKDLFANHCDDVIELFEPEAVVVARWPVIAGRFDHEPLSEEAGCASAAIVLEDAVVRTPLGERALETLTIGNVDYGCIPG